MTDTRDEESTTLRKERDQQMYFFPVRSGNGWPMLRFAIRRCG
jgi:hypothetical protein